VIRLPLSGLSLMVRAPTSSEELYVLESDSAPTFAILEVANRVVSQSDGTAVDWASLPASEVGAIALVIRQAWVGDQLSTEGSCPNCGERVSVSFSVGDYVSHFQPAVPSYVQPDGTGWYKLVGRDVRFRVPKVADLLVALDNPEGAMMLSGSCVEPAELDYELWSNVDDALEEISPNFDGMVGGQCPECGTTVQLRFDPCAYVLAELRDLFAGIYYEVHLLARAYAWAEEDILAMGRSRRIKYAHLVSEEQSVR
jgi:predicted RNA-binding Zn-ribbon protein involved in translation (DUF1610 family)